MGSCWKETQRNTPQPGGHAATFAIQTLLRENDTRETQPHPALHGTERSQSWFAMKCKHLKSLGFGPNRAACIRPSMTYSSGNSNFP